METMVFKPDGTDGADVAYALVVSHESRATYTTNLVVIADDQGSDSKDQGGGTD